MADEMATLLLQHYFCVILALCSCSFSPSLYPLFLPLLSPPLLVPTPGAEEPHELGVVGAAVLQTQTKQPLHVCTGERKNNKGRAG